MKFWDLVRKYNNVKFKIRSKEIEERELMELQCLPKKSDFNVPGSPGYNGSPVEKFVIVLDEVRQKQEELKVKMQAIRNELVKSIETLDDYFARQVVELVLFRTTPKPNWEKVAVSIGYSQSGARALYKTATTKLEKLELEEMKDEYIW